ncbi:MAG TPA: sulfite exporter TauE/SafE family protein [Abditibacteriaceae bacterium]|nr:sulfite exporter TauE/SafE family protein [Abditibacteriaceae bacterium]
MDVSFLLLLLTGLIAGIAAGFFGIGGGLVIVPALVYILGFSQHKATGTSLVCLLPPLGIGAVYQYWKAGNVDVRAAVVIGSMLLIGGFLGGKYANKLNGAQLSFAFGIFAVAAGIYTMWTAWQKMRG